ncbi:hypothetical protein GON01_02305 [Sphingomonas sp. MAH-20]|jgi:hypothetical protein|uniref:PilZ domain-containing protein n=1 Tax=Sphingomonas horti TaxID=2682842 RepID=A0A6I4IXW5_9SPHN|nr:MULTISPECIES: PilZ domain-containing protein [Sphingomonas]MBA2920521.1 PilZ domain-containing protein [Sphingomonas sp. CGMCC 1.13658]MVO76773.1 hypothetical protein [Sphingomonas horti]
MASQGLDRDGRAEPRLKVFRLGRARADGVPFKVHILDVSKLGARLHASQAPDLGIRITLDCASVSASGTVRWVDARRFGIRFDKPLVQSELATIVAADGA